MQQVENRKLEGLLEHNKISGYEPFGKFIKEKHDKLGHETFFSPL